MPLDARLIVAGEVAMTTEAISRPPITAAPAAAAEGLRLVQSFARVLLEYNVGSSILAAKIERLATHLGIHLQAAVSYRRVALHLADGRCFNAQAPEYRLNVVVSAGALRLVDEF